MDLLERSRKKNRPFAKRHDGGVRGQVSGVRGQGGASVLQQRLQLVQRVGNALSVAFLQTMEELVPGIASDLEMA